MKAGFLPLAVLLRGANVDATFLAAELSSFSVEGMDERCVESDDDTDDVVEEDVDEIAESVREDIDLSAMMASRLLIVSADVSECSFTDIVDT